MNGVDTLRSAFQSSYTWFDGTVADVTDEQAGHTPPGRAHPIAALVAHVHQSEDWAVQELLQGKQTLWESGGWEEKLGIPNLITLTEDCAVNPAGCVAALAPYGEAVRAATAAYLDGASEADLDREIDMSAFHLPMMRAGDVLTLLPVSNTLAHTGEISAIKGTLGAQGYAF